MKKMQIKTMNRLSIAVVAVLVFLLCLYFHIFSAVAISFSGLFEEHYKKEIEERLDYPIMQLHVGAYGLQKYSVGIHHKELTNTNQLDLTKHLINTLREYKNEKKSILTLSLSCRLFLSEDEYVHFRTKDFISVEAVIFTDDMEMTEEGRVIRETMSVDDFYIWLEDYMNSFEKESEELPRIKKR